jgi:RNA polymerase sigma-70 factor (ECF subfamily)
VPHEDLDAAQMLHALLDKLDDDQRAVFIMAELEGMTANEIAMATATKPATVYSRLRLAREALARHVARIKAQARTGARR